MRQVLLLVGPIPNVGIVIQSFNPSRAGDGFMLLADG